MKTRQEIIQEINPKMAEEFEIDEATILPDAAIFETLELDSISLIDLIGIVHANFGIKIGKEEIPQIKTLNDLYDYIEKNQQS
jgi:acyl carrier protein